MRARRTFAAAAGPAESELPEAAHDVLRGGTTGPILELERARLRVGAVPLLRREENGRLGQCIRIAGTGAGRVELVVTCGETVMDRTALELEERPRSCRLFVPEGERRVRLAVRRDGGAESAHLLDVVEQRRWTVFLVHHSHLDIGYTDLQPEVLRHHRAYLDSVLELSAATDLWADDARFRWNVEGNLPLRQWLHERPTTSVAELVERVREGRIEVCALPYTLNVEACSIDELARHLAWAQSFASEHGVEVTTAMQTDVPGHGYGLPELLSAAGVRYLDVAHNWAARATPFSTGGWDLPRLFRWGAPGRDVLVWHTDSPRGIAYLEGNLLGLGDSVEAATELLPDYLAGLAEHGYPYGGEVEALGIPDGVEVPSRPYPLDVLHLRLQGTIADNAAPALAPAEVVRRWNAAFAFPVLRLATNREFFAAAEERAQDVPRLEGDWTSWWADGLGSSARLLGANRRAQAKLRTAQTLHVLADVTVERDGRWTETAECVHDWISLFDEHTWGAAFPEGDESSGRAAGELQWQLKSSYALEAEAGADSMLAAAVARLAGRARGLRVAVVNVCPFVRTDRVDLFVPSSVVGAGTALEVRVPGGGSVASVAVPVGGAGERNRPQGQRISFVASDVPALGYRAFELRRTDGPPPVPRAAAGCVLLSGLYRVEVDPLEGCVTSLVDRTLDRELVNLESPFGLGQYVHDRLLEPLRPTRRADLGTGVPSHARPAGASRVLARRSTPTAGVVTSRTSSEVEERLTVRLEAEGAALLETTFTLVHGVRRVELSHRLVKPAVAEKESVHFTFPFALTDPRRSYELTGGALSPDGPRLPGSARHVNAIRHWVALQDGEVAVAWASLEAALLQLGDLYAPYPPYGPTVGYGDPGLVVSWAMNNVWDTNFPTRQGGETRFTYAVSSAEPGSDARPLAARAASSLTQPLVGILGAFAGRDEGSFCSFDRDDVELIGLGPSDAGHDFTLRLRSLAHEPTRLRIEFPELPVERLLAGSFFERNLVEVTGGNLELDPDELVVLAVDLRR